MGLDAVVCCNCVENRNFKTPPKPEWEIYTDSNGYIECDIEDLDKQIEFDLWRRDKACEHEDCHLVHHYLGNIAGVANLRKSLQKYKDELPIITEEIIYCGTHCGGWLEVETVKSLQTEYEKLQTISLSNKEDEERLRYFEKQLGELIDASIKMNKPIAF